jgi:hypothetical protein
MTDAAAPAAAINKKTPAIARPPNTGPILEEDHVYPETHKKTNIITAAVAASAIPAMKAGVKPVLA